MPNRMFAERLNKELDTIGLPLRLDERIAAFAKLVNIPKFKAEIFLSGNNIPESALLQTIAKELEVDPDWLVGKT